ncbi:hypothetical protein ETB97_004196 [Aspergillus alliaceus]|uniref:Uncharacterized protein n=1 Tax=Petromyces alliaceus TaxID=209559 RepID=A0A8H6EAB0_PETAA|nr:hypothetical protein ETB97_004196 [Aspergillus burnettii]
MGSKKTNKKSGLYSAAIEKRINEDSKKKRPTPSPGPEPSGSNKAKCERKGDDDEEVFTMDDFPTEVLLKAHYMATKQSSLDRPLGMFESDVTLAASIRAHAGANPPASDRENFAGTPLSNDAISNILKEVKPDCNKAQAWVKAHEASKAAKERAKVKLEGREDLRKRAVRLSYDRARQTASQSNAPRHEAGDLAPVAVPEVSEGRTVNEELEESRVVYNRVSLAHDRLLKTISDIEEFRKAVPQ